MKIIVVSSIIHENIAGNKKLQKRNCHLSSIYAELFGMFGVLSRQDFLAQFVISFSSDLGVSVPLGVLLIWAMIVFVSCFSALQNLCTIL